MPRLSRRTLLIAGASAGLTGLGLRFPSRARAGGIIPIPVFRLRHVGSAKSPPNIVPCAVNEADQVVGVIGKSLEAPRAQGVSITDGVPSLSMIPGTVRSVYTGITGSGSICGWAAGRASRGGVRAQAAFIFADEEVRWLEPDALSPDSLWTRAWGINDQGDVAGTAGDLAAVWTAAGRKDFRVPSALRSLATSINNSGIAAGRAIIQPFPRIMHAYRFADQGALDMHPAGAFSSWANAINDTGAVVGAVQSSEDGFSQATLWRDGAVIDLHPEGALSSEATSINNSGIVVGYARFARQLSSWYWRDGVLTTFDELVTDPTIAFIYKPVDINDQGHVLASARRREGRKVYDEFVLLPLS